MSNISNIIYLVYHTFLAGWCGDAAGATLEFKKCRFSYEEVIYAMKMPGHGTSHVYPGQVTDDSEMELALIHGLIKGCESDYFPTDFIANEYIEWYNSEPIDIGQTTTFAILDAKNDLKMYENSNTYNLDSESNGALMRCIPLAVTLMNKSPGEIMDITSLDVELTHPNRICVQITGIYCIIIAHILKQRILGNMDINIDELFKIIKKNTTIETISSWINEAINMESLNQYDSIKNEGHIKHAFMFVIYFLKNINNYYYEKALIEVLQCGGDTDTNAKIVGNLFGAYYGNCIPDYMSKPVLDIDVTTIPDNFFRRPRKYSIKHNLGIIEKLVSIIRC